MTEHPLGSVGRLVVGRITSYNVCYTKLLRPERQDSVANGLRAIPLECELVVVHDGVRPLVRVDLLEAVLEAAHHHGAAIAAIPAGDTVKQAENQKVVATLERETIWLAQTPQAFHANLLRRAYVITSYSIHYTKLYECLIPSVLEWLPPPPSRMGW